jgi:hypothetical protein
MDESIFKKLLQKLRDAYAREQEYPDEPESCEDSAPMTAINGATGLPLLGANRSFDTAGNPHGSSLL